MSCAMSPLRGEECSVQEFQFDGAYAGAVSPRKEAAGSTKRQPKRRGLWNCFAQPRADESNASAPSHASPSRLTLTAQQLAFRSSGKQEEQVLPLSSIKDVQFKWIQAGGVRVSKVTLTLDSGKESIVIRGLKNPEHLVDAVRKRQQAAVTRAEKSPEIAARRSCDPPRTSPAGRWSEPAISPSKRVMITPRALFTDANGSTASAANSGCGSMTLMSAFARSPAQDFAGAESVAREIQLASPGREDLSYSSSSDSTVHEVVTMRATAATADAAAAVATAAARLASRALPSPSASDGVPRTMLPPPCQASDSFALPPYAVLHSSVAAAAQLAPTVGNGPTEQSDELAVAGMTLHTAQNRRRAEENLAGVTTTRMTSEGSPLLGGSPPPRAEDSMPDGASVPASVAGSPHPVQSCTAGGSPPPVPEDSVVVHAAGGDGGSTPVSPLCSNALKAACRPISPCAGGGAADPSRAALLEPFMQAGRPAGLGSQVVLEPSPVAAAGAAAGSSGSGDSGGFPAETPYLLPQNEDSHQHAHSSLAAAPPAPHAAGDGSSEEPAESVGPSGGSSFQSASSGELTDGSSSALPPDSSAEPALALASTCGPAPGSGASYMPDRRATSPVGALGIAAVSATVSAVLTSAATASLGAVGLAASPPIAAAAASSTAAVAVASVGAAPLTLLGLTAAAAVTLVAAAAVTHIRTGSPLRPLQSPSDVDALGAAAAHAEPILSARARESDGQVPESPASWFGGDRSCGKSVGNTGPASVGCSFTAAAAESPQAAVVTATPAGDEPVSAAALIGAVSRACATPTVDLAAEPSLRCGPSNEGSAGVLEGETGCRSPATGASGATAGSGDGSEEDGATSGAWGSQPTLVEFEAEHQAAAAGSAVQSPAQPSLGGTGSCGGAAAAAGAALGLGEQQPHQQHSEAEEEPLPVMLFSEGPGGMPPVSRSAEPGVGEADAAEAPNAPTERLPEQSPAVRCLGLSEGAWCSATIAGDVCVGGASDGQCAHPAEHAVDGGELRPPPPAQLLATAEPAELAPFAYGGGSHRTVQVWGPSQPAVAAHRDPTVRQLFRDDDPPSYSPATAPAPSGSSAQWRHQQQQHQQNQGADEEEAAHAPCFGAPPPSAAAGIKASPLLQEAAACGLSPSALAQAAASRATRRRWAQHLTESPVRVLYSVHAAFTGLPPGAPVQWAMPVHHTSESAVQTEAPMIECAVQTEAEVRGRVGADGRSETVRHHSSSSGSGAVVAAQSLEESATQRVFTLNSPEESSNGGSPGAGSHASVSVAAGPDDPEGDASPPQVGAQDWYMSSVGADAALGGFELAAAASRGGARDALFESPSTADSSAYSSSPSPQGGSPAAAQTSVEGFGSGVTGPRAIAHHSVCLSITRSQPAGEPSRLARVATPHDGGCASATTNEEETPLLGRSAQDSRRGNATAQSAVHQLSPALRALLGLMRPTCPAAPAPGSGSTVSMTSSPSLASSSAPESASVGSGLYTPMMSDASGSGARAAAATALSRGDSHLSSSSAANAASEGGTGAQRRLLAAGLPLSAEPLTPWAAQASSPSVFAAFGGANRPSASSTQGSSFPETLRAGGVSAVTVEPPSSRSALSDVADDMVWLLGPAAGAAGATDDDLVSAPGSPRIPPPPPLAHSNTTSRGGSAISRRITVETMESLGGAAGCCSSRRSSSGSCGEQGTAAAAAADYASLAWLLARGSVIRSAAAEHSGIAPVQAGPVPDPCLDGNQLATVQPAGACALAAERAAAANQAGLHARTSGSESNSSSVAGLSGSSSRTTHDSCEGLTAGTLLGPLAMCAAVSAPNVGVRACSCSGNGGDSAIAASSQTGSPVPHSPSGASTAGSRTAAPSPDLSDISSAAYAAGAYVYGSPYSNPGADTPGGPRAGPDVRAAGAGGSDGGAGDDLFQNPLYSTPRNDAADKSPRARQPRDSSGCIALPLMPYSDGVAYGGGTFTCTTTTTTTDSSETVSAEPRTLEQPTMGSDLPAGAGRRRTREEAGAPPLYSYQYDAKAGTALRAEDVAVASRHGSADGAEEPYSRAAGAASLPGGTSGVSEDGLAVGPGGTDSTSREAQPLKRARTQVPQADVASWGSAQQQQELLCTPAPAPGPGGTAPARGLPLVSPLMVLNPTYSQSAGGSPGMTSSPPAAPSDDVLAVRADATPRHGEVALGGGLHWNTAAAAKPEAAGCRGDDNGAALVVVEQPRSPLQITPRNRELLQLQSSDWGSTQGSPSSQQAVHAAALLRNANDAVDFAREAVQRGDAQWLSRVTATLQAVQSALDALREF